MTDDEIDAIAKEMYGGAYDTWGVIEFARAIIAADRAQRKPMQNDEVDALLRGTEVAIDIGVIIEAIYYLDGYLEKVSKQMATETRPARCRRLLNRVEGVQLTLASLREALTKIPDQTPD